MEKTFETFAKVNDRHYKTVRERAKITPYQEAPQEWVDDAGSDDFYNEEMLAQLEENDEIAANEAGFMRGFLSA